MDEKYYQPKKLSPRHLAIMRELLCGTRQKEISQLFSITPNRLSTIINSPRFKEKMGEMKNTLTEKFTTKEATKDSVVDKARKIIEDNLEEGVRNVVDIMKDVKTSPDVSLRASTVLMDRGGLVKMEKVRVEGKMDISENLKFALSLPKKNED